MWVTRGPFRRLPKGLCDFVDTTTHTLVGGAQTTLSRQRPARARIVETADWPLANAKRDVDLEINKTHTPPLARRFGPQGRRGGHRGRRYGPEVAGIRTYTGVGKGFILTIIHIIAYRQVRTYRLTFDYSHFCLTTVWCYNPTAMQELRVSRALRIGQAKI